MNERNHPTGTEPEPNNPRVLAARETATKEVERRARIVARLEAHLVDIAAHRVEAVASRDAAQAARVAARKIEQDALAIVIPDDAEDRADRLRERDRIVAGARRAIAEHVESARLATETVVALDGRAVAAVAKLVDARAAAAVDLAPVLVQVERSEGWWDAYRLHDGSHLVMTLAEPSATWTATMQARRDKDAADLAAAQPEIEAQETKRAAFEAIREKRRRGEALTEEEKAAVLDSVLGV